MRTNEANEGSTEVMQGYKVGDSDRRPWGHYVVTAVGLNAAGEEYCEKEITIRPGQVLSLQSHDMRRETWKVVKGTLTVLVDGRSVQLNAGEETHIPERSIHCMANLEDTDCVVFERQEGMCREEDIHRYVDAYGRETDVPLGGMVAASVAVYNDLVSVIRPAAA